MTKRFEVRLNTCYGRHLIHDGTEPMGNQTACDLLNAQAEQIEVLREWINMSPINEDYDDLADFERNLVRIQQEGGCGGMESRVELAKRRLAALEGT